jgi:hypothetical protein
MLEHPASPESSPAKATVISARIRDSVISEVLSKVLGGGDTRSRRDDVFWVVTDFGGWRRSKQSKPSAWKATLK